MGCGATNGRRTLKIYTHARGRSLALARPTPHEKPSPSAPLNTSSHARSATAVSRRICKILALLPPACAVGVAPALRGSSAAQSKIPRDRTASIYNHQPRGLGGPVPLAVLEDVRTVRGIAKIRHWSAGLGREKDFYRLLSPHRKEHGHPTGEGWGGEERKQTTQGRDGTPPPHRDFKGRSAVLAVAHPCASTFSYLCSQFLANSRSDLHATSRSSHSRPRSLSCCFKTQNGIAKNLSLCFIL